MQYLHPCASVQTSVSSTTSNSGVTTNGSTNPVTNPHNSTNSLSTSSANNSGAQLSKSSSLENNNNTLAQNVQNPANNLYVSSLYQTVPGTSPEFNQTSPGNVQARHQNQTQAAMSTPVAATNTTQFPTQLQNQQQTNAAAQAALTDYMMAIAAQQRLLNSFNPAWLAAALGGNNVATSVAGNIQGLGFPPQNTNANTNGGFSTAGEITNNESIALIKQKMSPSQCHNGVAMSSSNNEYGTTSAAAALVSSASVDQSESPTIANDNCANKGSVALLCTPAELRNSSCSLSGEGSMNNSSSSSTKNNLKEMSPQTDTTVKNQEQSSTSKTINANGGGKSSHSAVSTNVGGSNTPTGLDSQQQLLLPTSTSNCFGMTLPMERTTTLTSFGCCSNVAGNSSNAGNSSAAAAGNGIAAHNKTGRQQQVSIVLPLLRNICLLYDVISFYLVSCCLFLPSFLLCSC